MSEYSGKCDLWDTLVSIGELTDDYDWLKVYIYQDNERLPINSLKDLIKYAPYLISSMSYSRDSGKYHINICSESYLTERSRFVRAELGIDSSEFENYYRSLWYEDMIKFGYSEEEALTLSKR